MFDASSTLPPRQAPIAQGAAVVSALPDIIVTGRRDRPVANGTIKPVKSIDQAVIGTYRARSIGDLVNAMSIDIPSLRGNHEPIILVNGRPIANSASISDFPPEALAKLEIYPETAAPYYGRAANRRVVNLVTQSRFAATEGEAHRQTATDGGRQTAETAAQWSRISGDRRVRLSLNLRREARLLESERGIRSSDNGELFALAEDVGPSSGDDIVPVPSGLADGTAWDDLDGFAPPLAHLAASSMRFANIPRYRSLMPSVSHLDMDGSFTTPLANGVTGTVDAKIMRAVSASLLGPGVVTLATALPASSLADHDVSFYDHLDDVPPLRQSTLSTGFEIGLSLNGDIGRWTWSTIAAVDHRRVSTRTDTAILVAPLPQNPAAGIPPSLIERRSRDRALSQSDTISIKNQFNGRVTRIAGRDIFGKIELSWTGVGQGSSFVANSDDPTWRNLHQSTFKMEAAVDIPITPPGSAIGELAFAVNGAATRTAGFRPFTTLGYALNWLPAPAWRLSLSAEQDKTLPDPLQLSAPVIGTPSVTVFDYVKAEDVQVLAISGGNPALKSERRDTMNLDFAYTPDSPTGLRLSVGYARTRTRDGIASLPAPSLAVQAAFPLYFIRSSNGTLLSIDTRPVNLAANSEGQLRTAVTFSPGLGLRKDEKLREQSSDRLSLTLEHTWSLEKSYRLQAGGPRLNILGGDGVIGGDGQSRHMLSVTGQMSIHGVGLNFAGLWKNGFRTAPAGDVNALRFSSLMTWNSNLSFDLGRSSAKTKGALWSPLQVSLAITNAFNAHQRVRNAVGKTPLSYQPAILDALGRTVSVSLRKLF